MTEKPKKFDELRAKMSIDRRLKSSVAARRVLEAMAKYENSPIPIISITVNGCECIVNGEVELFSSQDNAEEFAEWLRIHVAERQVGE